MHSSSRIPCSTLLKNKAIHRIRKTPKRNSFPNCQSSQLISQKQRSSSINIERLCRSPLSIKFIIFSSIDFYEFSFFTILFFTFQNNFFLRSYTNICYIPYIKIFPIRNRWATHIKIISEFFLRFFRLQTTQNW